MGEIRIFLPYRHLPPYLELGLFLHAWEETMGWAKLPSGASCIYAEVSCKASHFIRPLAFFFLEDGDPEILKEKRWQRPTTGESANTSFMLCEQAPYRVEVPSLT
jgi:hypothetical protein